MKEAQIMATTLKLEDLTTEFVSKLIEEGKANGHTLWFVLTDQKQREVYALRPAVWEGPGQYQSVEIFDADFGLHNRVLVKTPAGPAGWSIDSFPINKPDEPVEAPELRVVEIIVRHSETRCEVCRSGSPGTCTPVAEDDVDHGVAHEWTPVTIATGELLPTSAGGR